MKPGMAERTPYLRAMSAPTRTSSAPAETVLALSQRHKDQLQAQALPREARHGRARSVLARHVCVSMHSFSATPLPSDPHQHGSLLHRDPLPALAPPHESRHRLAHPYLPRLVSASRGHLNAAMLLPDRRRTAVLAGILQLTASGYISEGHGKKCRFPETHSLPWISCQCHQQPLARSSATQQDKAQTSKVSPEVQAWLFPSILKTHCAHCKQMVGYEYLQEVRHRGLTDSQGLGHQALPQRQRKRPCQCAARSVSGQQRPSGR